MGYQEDYEMTIETMMSEDPAIVLGSPHGEVHVQRLRGKDVYVCNWKQMSGGKMRRCRVYAHTKRDALRRKVERIREIAIEEHNPEPQPQTERTRTRGTKGTRSNPTVSMFLETWLKGDKNAGGDSKRKYRNNIEAHVLPIIGNRFVKRLTSGDIDNMKKRWDKDGLGHSAQWHTWTTLNTMLNYAVRKNIIMRNPMLGCDEKPRKANPTAARDNLAIDKRTDIMWGVLSWLADPDCPMHRHWPLIQLMLLGLRRSELLGLPCDVIDGKNGIPQFVIRQQLKQKEGGGWYVCNHLKSHHEERRFQMHYPYDAAVQEAIRQRNEITERLREQGRDDVCIDIMDENSKEVIGRCRLLFVREDGTNYTYNDYYQIWYEVLLAFYRRGGGHPSDKLTRDEYWRPHANRHITASLLLRLGVPIEVTQTIIGHMSPEMTAHYQHVYAASKENATSGLGDFVYEQMRAHTLRKDFVVPGRTRQRSVAQSRPAAANTPTTPNGLSVTASVADVVP